MTLVVAPKPQINASAGNEETPDRNRLKRLVSWLSAWRKVVIAEILCFTAVEVL